MTALEKGLLLFSLISLFPLFSFNYLERGSSRRKTSSLGFGSLLWQGCLLVLLWITWQEGLWTASSTGLRSHVPWSASIAIGFVLYLSSFWLASLLYGVVGLRRQFDFRSLMVLRRMWPESGADRAMLILACCLNPFTEELIYRGILVNQCAGVIGSFGLALSFGLLLCLGTHVYQGIFFAPFHAGFFAVAVSLLESPLGRPGAMGLHLAADLMPFMLLLRARARRRSRSREAVSAGISRAISS